MTDVLEAPATEVEVAACVADAARAGRRLQIVGGGTRLALGRPVSADATLSTARLDGVTLYEPEALTLVAGAGTRVADVERLLAAEGQRLPFEPMDHRALLGSTGEPTLGGMVAVGASGPARIARGACRDSLIGVRFVDGRGTVVKNGGRVMKNVTGYDLVKLMCGAYGTLGVLTEVAFKLLPLPETVATLRLDGLEDDRAVAALSAALGSPFDVTGAAHWPGRGTFVRIEGFAASVAYRAERLAETLRPFGVAAAEDDPQVWTAIRDARPVAEGAGAVWRVSVRPSDAPAVAARIAPDAALYDWGGGLLWFRIAENADAGAAALRAAVDARGGHATLVRADAPTRRAVPPFHPEKPPVAALSAGLRAKFDPAGVLNPGRMG